MLKVYVCEDNKQQRELMSQLIQEVILVENLVHEMEYVAATGKPEELLEYVKKENEVGIFFLDIDLQSDINGIELAQKIRQYQPRGYIIFVTTHSEMSHLTFKYKVEALDYIIKDRRDELKVRVHECLLHAMQSEQEPEETEKEECYLIEIGERVTTLPYDKILYFEGSKTKNKMYVNTQDQSIEFTGNMKNVAEQVDERFYRCHRSFLINMDQVEKVDKKNNIVFMRGGAECQISVRLKKSFMEALEKHEFFRSEQMGK